jgi:hypothetical protein
MGSLKKQYTLPWKSLVRLAVTINLSFSQEIALVKIAVAWLVCQSYSLPNLIKYCNANINTKINTKPATVVEPGVLIYFLILPTYDRTWKCRFSDAEINNLNKHGCWRFSSHRWQLWNGPYIRKEIKIFPNNALIEIPSTHILFQNLSFFPVDYPKSHEHDGKRPRPTVL